MAEDGERRSPTSHRTPTQIRRQVAGYNHRPEQIRKRVQRDKARRLLMKEGLVKKYDGKDVNHKKPIRSGGGNERSNLSVQPRSKNRAWEKKSTKEGPTMASNKSGYKKPHKPGVFKGGLNPRLVKENKRSPTPKKNPRKSVAPKTSRKPKSKPKRRGY